MTKVVSLSFSDELFNIIMQEVLDNPFDYEGKITVFVRGCVIRRLKDLGKIPKRS